jgi:hypothetical protein
VHESKPVLGSVSKLSLAHPPEADKSRRWAMPLVRRSGFKTKSVDENRS